MNWDQQFQRRTDGRQRFSYRFSDWSFRENPVVNHLAQHTGWSAARVKRRIAALEASGALHFDVDLLPALLGFGVNAILWLTPPPRQLAAVAEEVVAHEEVASVLAVSGRFNLMAVVTCRDVEDLYRNITVRLAASRKSKAMT
jgi:DNA-binding Lrp family transcriptional regulator